MLRSETKLNFFHFAQAADCLSELTDSVTASQDGPGPELTVYAELFDGSCDDTAVL